MKYNGNLEGVITKFNLKVPIKNKLCNYDVREMQFDRNIIISLIKYCFYESTVENKYYRDFLTMMKSLLEKNNFNMIPIFDNGTSIFICHAISFKIFNDIKMLTD